MSPGELRRHLAAARLRATSRQPYLSSALFACALELRPGSGTIAVGGGWSLRVDPDLAARMEVDELARLLLHLTAHLVRDHAQRARRVGVQDGDRAGWNRCADAEVNDDLAAEDLLPAAAPTLPADVGKDDGGLAEAYYEDAADGPRLWDCGPGADGGDDDDGDGLRAEQQERLRHGVAAAVHRHARQEPGSVPGGWLRWAEEVLPAQVDWRRVLAAEVRRATAAIAGNVDYTYRRPSRRAHVAPDVVLPALHRPVPEVAIVCDTSGSMHTQLLARALAELDAIIARAGLRGRRVPVLAVDTVVQRVERATRATRLSLVGGGGTDMGAGLLAATKLRPRPQLVVVLTDGFTPWPAQRPAGTRVIIGVLRQGGIPPWPTPDWARIVEIEDETE